VKVMHNRDFLHLLKAKHMFQVIIITGNAGLDTE